VTERLLLYIWQFQHFNTNDLKIHSGEEFSILYPGMYNNNQGPDFLEAKIRIGNTLWIGNIEIHIQTSGWNKHAHQHDPNFNNVILHVVWEDDLPFEESTVPLFILQDRIPKLLINLYDKWMNSSTFIPCGQRITEIKPLVWMAWKERLLIERLQRKTGIIQLALQQNQYHWEEVCWYMLARNFGIKVNADSFEAIARTLPVYLLSKHKNQLLQLESLLLGQASLLDNNYNEAYPQTLQKEYQFYKTKYSLQSIHQPVHFLRMRPAAFPTIRLAQLAKLIHTSGHLFSIIKEIQDPVQLKKLFAITAGDYWDNHYCLDEPSHFKLKNLGAQMIDNIIINTIVPLLFAYGHIRKEESYKERAIDWLGQIPPENNNILHSFNSLGIGNQSAFDSQSLLELKSHFCDQKRCLDCAIGYELLTGE
jgi:hypothetical protein